LSLSLLRNIPDPEAIPRGKRLVEITTTGIDEFLQGIGGDPYGGSSWVGLRVPKLATPDFNHRYLFLAASFSVGEGETAIIRGYRQLVTLGKSVGTTDAPRVQEFEVTSPFWHLPDGDVSFHLRQLGPPNAQGWPRYKPSPLDLRCFKKGWSDGPALLYQDYTIPAGDKFYTHVTAYTPPARGQPWGTPPSDGQQGTFYDLRTPWRDAHAWSSLDMAVEGPETIGLFISVRQSAGNYSVATSPLNFSEGLLPEEQFIGNFGGGDAGIRPIYWRVGASLIVEH
jgi:hypothetical protein